MGNATKWVRAHLRLSWVRFRARFQHKAQRVDLASVADLWDRAGAAGQRAYDRALLIDSTDQAAAEEAQRLAFRKVLDDDKRKTSGGGR